MLAKMTQKSLVDLAGPAALIASTYMLGKVLHRGVEVAEHITVKTQGTQIVTLSCFSIVDALNGGSEQKHC